MSTTAPQPAAAPEVAPAPDAPVAAARARWLTPAITWEQPFVALAQVSAPPCIPGQDPRCTP